MYVIEGAAITSGHRTPLKPGELQAQVASQLVTAAALTLDGHLEKLGDEARQRGQLSAAIDAEVKRRRGKAVLHQTSRKRRSWRIRSYERRLRAFI